MPEVKLSYSKNVNKVYKLTSDEFEEFENVFNNDGDIEIEEFLSDKKEVEGHEDADDETVYDDYELLEFDPDEEGDEDGATSTH